MITRNDHAPTLPDADGEVMEPVALRSAFDSATAAAKKDKPGPTVNACTTCAPLGASLVFRGVRGALPLLHGSQGCATYIRRYLISHFREPMDIASSSFTEGATIFGGESNLDLALDNIVARYRPEVIGVATTCLAETMGEDVGSFLRRWRAERAGRELPTLVMVSTPSFRSTHSGGFHATVAAVAEQLAESGTRGAHINLLPNLVSPSDLRHFKEICAQMGIDAVLLPDYSDTLDGPSLAEYRALPAGGTPIERLRQMGSASATITCGRCCDDQAAQSLSNRHGVTPVRVGLPIGVRETDAFIDALLAHAPGATRSAELDAERGRLLDAYVDGHKYLFGKTAAVVGDEDLVVGLCAFLSEIGIQPVLAGSGGRSGRMRAALNAIDPSLESCEVFDDADHATISNRIGELRPDIVLGPSKSYRTCRDLGIPLMRVGFPVHDRIGANRMLHLGYRGTMRLFDELVNTLLTRQQDQSEIGYSYM
jgi:nitrogenase molybdenum-iron protein NifN